MKKLVLSAAAIGVIILILADAPRAILYTHDALYMCSEMIVPTLFPFFVCSGILIYSGFCQTLSGLFKYCMKPLFNVSPAGSSAFILGIISGYPLGAITAGELYQNSYITKCEAERLLAFCNNSGPLFILVSVGVAMYTKIRYGIILYLVHILASLTVGIIFRFYKYRSYTAPKTVITVPKRSVGEIFNIALQNSISNMLTVCGAVIIFSTASRLFLDLIHMTPETDAFISGIFEFVTGSVKISNLTVPIAKKLIMSAVIIGFAGLSVHLQVIAVTAKYSLSLAPYFIGKILHGLISGLYMWLYLRFNPITTAVFYPSMSKSFAASSAYVLLCAALAAVMCFSFGLSYGLGRKMHKN